MRPRFALTIYAVAAATLSVALSTAPALAQTPVFSQTLRGKMIATGNALGLDSSATGTPGKRGGIGTFIANPLEFPTASHGTYGVGTTIDPAQNGSSATLDLPPGVGVANATLLWGCSSQVAGAPATPLTTPAFVTLTLPSGVKQVVSPTGEDTALTLVSAGNKYFYRWANVTGAVATGGGGSYTVSRVFGVPTSSAITGCGWSLFVVYEKDNLELKNINLWITSEEVRFNGTGGDGQVCPCDTIIDVDGFCTPPFPSDATGTLFITAMEGDPQYFNDELGIADPLSPGDFFPLSGPNNAADNFFAAQIEKGDGTLDTRGTFGNKNHSVNPNNGASFTLVDGARQGWDLAQIPVNDGVYNSFVLDNDQSQTTLRVTSGGITGEGDDFVLGAIGLELEVASPLLVSEHEVDRTATFAGDVITSTVFVYNDGNGPADDVFFCFAFPSNVTFTGAFEVDGAPQNGITVAQLNPQNCANRTGGVSIGGIPAGFYTEVTLSYRVDAIQPAPSPQASVVVTPSFHSAWTPDCAGAPNQRDDQVGETRTIPGLSLNIQLAVNPTTPPAVNAGATLTYTVTVTNPTSVAATGVALRIGVPAGSTYVANSATVNGAPLGGASVPWGGAAGATLPTVPPNGQVVVTFQVTVTATQATTIVQTAYVDLDGSGPAAEKASNSVFTQVAGQIVTPTDTDQDGIVDPEDNCVLTPNSNQWNHYDQSGFNPSAVDEGDACDDTDGDGLFDLEEDKDGDGRDPNETDATKVDTDGDALCDGASLIAPCIGVEDSDGDKAAGDWGTSEPSPVDADSDGDGICDGRNAGGECVGGEVTNGTLPLDTDSDGDGLCDGPGGGPDGSGCVGDETGGDGAVTAGTDTNPAKSDTDGDQLCDGFQNGALDCQGAEDRDGDRLSDDYDQPQDNETNPLAPDTDGGGVKDGVEVLQNSTNPRDRCDGDLVNCEIQDDDNDGIPNDADLCNDKDGDNYGVGPNCAGEDCDDTVKTCTTDCSDRNGGDGNGVPDCAETCADGDGDGFGTGVGCLGPDCDDTEAQCTVDCSDFDNDSRPNCVDPDDDNDGLPDAAELTRGTDPRNPDTDGDRLLDGAEVNNYGTNPNDSDTDDDGLFDGDEVENWQTDPANPDTDGEGLKDGEEVLTFGTNPKNADTDFGGMDDKTEVDSGRNAIDNPGDDVAGKYQGSSATGCGAGGGLGGGILAGIGVLFAALWRARRRRVLGGLLAASLALVVAGNARAQERREGVNLNHFLVKPGADRIFSVEGSEVAPAWTPYGGVWGHFLSNPLKFVTEGAGGTVETKVVETLMQLEAGIGFGLGGIAELEVILPVTLISEGDETLFPDANAAGLGDLVARLRFELLGRDKKGNGFGINLGVATSVPTGSGAGGDQGAQIAPKLSLAVGAGPLLVALNAGVSFRTDDKPFNNIALGNELFYGLGIQVQAIDALAIGMEIFGKTPLDSMFEDETEGPLELAGGVKLRFARAIHIDLGGGVGILPGYGAPDFRAFAGVQYAPYASEPDTDGDGFLDSEDKCPREPEDKDGYQDLDGCPDPDNDNDGVLDLADACRDVPEDIDTFEDDDGCPDPDNDKDGLLDTADSCPDNPEDKDGFEDADGCPDPDNDKDGIVDTADSCIDEPETVNEYQDTDGCPDSPPLARIEGCKIVIGEKVYFDTGKATIKPVSFPLLNEVARIIKENPGIQRIDVEGHTDADGSAAMNRSLSDRRAKAVRTYLTKQGIPGKKLTGKGYGEDKPIADNTTPEGKEKNRRVEFIVRDASCGK